MRGRIFTLASLIVLVAGACAEDRRDLSELGRRSENVQRRQHNRPREETRTPSRARHKDRPTRAISKVDKPKVRQPKHPAPVGRSAYVSRVIDGDTIEVVIDGTSKDVRLIGFDTPETVHPTEPVECFGRAASAYTTQTLSGRTVRIEYDVERKDHYGRTLAYVWMGERLFNEEILRDGFAQVSTYPPNVKYVDRFLSAQRSAREANRGLWSSCAGGGAAGSQPVQDNKPKPVAAGGGSCDPNYSGTCVPSYPPDIDCPDVPATDFASKDSDPHGFDGDGDGVACES